jgi:hypothetical protein
MAATEPPTFLDLVDQLTRDRPGTVTRDNGDEERTQLGLLHQLRSAVFGGMENTGGSSAFGSKPPIDTAAVDILEEITSQAAQVLAAVDQHPTPFGQAETYVRLWAGQTTEAKMFTISTRATVHNPDENDTTKPRVFDELTEISAYRLLERWIERIQSFFNPPGSREIAAPCPECGERYLYRLKDGEHIQSAAVNISRDRETGLYTEARCGVCTKVWPRSELEALARLVGARPIPELADDTPKEEHDGLTHTVGESMA